MKDDDQNIYEPDAFEKYEQRKHMNDICLADFVANFNKKVKRDGEIEMHKREHRKVIRYVRYSHKQDPTNFFREQCFLFLPWRNEETDINNRNYQKLYERNRTIIQENRKPYVTIPDDEIDELFKMVKQNDDDGDLNIPDDLNEADRVEMIQRSQDEQDENVDIMIQAGVDKPIPETSNKDRYFLPKKLLKDDILAKLASLNKKQRQFVMHVVKKIKTNDKPFYYHLNGAAGVRKTTVINVITQLVTYYTENTRGENPDTLKVLLTNRKSGMHYRRYNTASCICSSS